VRDLQKELESACLACSRAGAVIRRHYDRGETAATLKPDSSPLTEADIEANGEILALIRESFPDDGILSEESADDGSRLTKSRVWIVDPLDGTRDFVRRSGDFAVHVGLAVEGTPTLGAVYKPVGDELYWAVAGEGAYLRAGGRERRLSTSAATELSELRIGVTRFNVNQNLQRFLAESGLARQVVRIGASIKMMALARGDIELSACLNADEKEWDTCAPEVVVREAGGTVSDIDGAPFCYNRPNVHHLRGILMSNGPLHTKLVEMLRPFLAS